MTYLVRSEVLARTRLCKKDFACLDDGGCENCARCVIVGENAINALYLSNRAPSDCPYYCDGESAHLCTCPTRYALYKQNGS